MDYANIDINYTQMAIVLIASPIILAGKIWFDIHKAKKLYDSYCNDKVSKTADYIVKNHGKAL
ncbi:MAG: hypothetical protein FWC61_04270 [Proteobacteria bacterium]|nr:hypothetical protein [Pseudomonadota bacterium]